MSYKVTKPAGYTANIMIENETTNASVILGRVTMDIIHILKESLKDHEELIPKPEEEWKIYVSDETARELAKTTMRMKKPVRDQRKKPLEEERQKSNKEIDAMDVLLGLASYN